jgi:hypothetical protein
MSRHHDPDALLARLYQWPSQGDSAEQEQEGEELEEDQELLLAVGQEELVDVEPEEAICRIEEQVLLFLSCLTSGMQPDFYVVSKEAQTLYWQCAWPRHCCNIRAAVEMQRMPPCGALPPCFFNGSVCSLAACR